MFWRRKVVDKLTADGFADQVIGHQAGTFLLAFVHQFYLARDGRDDADQVGNANHRVDFFIAVHSSFGRRNQVFIGRDGESGRHPTFFVHKFGVARFLGDLLDQVLHQLGNVNAVHGLAVQLGFLCGDFFADGNGLRVVGDDLTFDTVLEWRHDATPVGIVFRVGGEDKLYV